MSEQVLCNLNEDEKIAFLEMLDINNSEIPKWKKDSRDISDYLMDEFMEGSFREFYKFARANKKLVICFRGNGNPEAITIYRFNHMVWELFRDISGNYCVKINYNHARYLGNLSGQDGKLRYIDELEALGFVTSPIKDSPTFDYFICAKQEAYSEEFVRKTYEIIVEDFMVSYFDPRMDLDSFRIIKKMPAIDRKVYPKHPYIEKRWQQSLFNRFQQFSENGIFVYDLEFSQKFPKDSIKKKLEKYINEPDMLGVRFCNGKIVSFLLIEVKSGETACSKSSSSGIPKHLQKMLEYSRFDILMSNRMKDAEKLLKRYQKMDKIPQHIDITIPKTVDIERILILTDNKIEEGEYAPSHRSAIAYFDAVSKYCKNRNSANWILESAKENQADIWIIEGQYYEEFSIRQVLRHLEIEL